MCRVDCQRCQDREHVSEKVILKPGIIRLAQGVATQNFNAFFGNLSAQLAPDLLLGRLQVTYGVTDLFQLFGRRQPVIGKVGDLGALLAAQSGHADHEKLVEIVGGDGQEPDTLKKRVVVVHRLFENPQIELQPGQFPVHETGWRFRQFNEFRKVIFAAQVRRGG